jgi:putative transposase
MRYNQRVITLNLEHGVITAATTKGRIKASFLVPEHCKGYLNWIIKSSAISYNRRSGEFYLHVSLEHTNPEEVTDLTVLGIDRGIVNIAVCSDNSFFNSRKVKNRRAKNVYLRKELQSKGTASAKRRLKRLSGRERRFATGTDHYIYI